jgi:hypothetical protein
MKTITKHTFGVGDRFAHQGQAQLRALAAARAAGIEVHPVWNKSNREHAIIGSQPSDVRAEADSAAAALGWDAPYFVDADHISLATVDAFASSSDFFTLDVADCIGQAASEDEIDSFARSVSRYVGALEVPGIGEALPITAHATRVAARKFLLAVQESGRIYRHICQIRGGDDFVTEVSMDETDAPQTPTELLLILAMLAREGVPAQTIAPKFSGHFHKGIDYQGDTARFEREFEDDLAVVAFAVREFGLPETLKLSVHSGSDKFSIYPAINRLTKKHGAGLHVKTAGTTWLEEVIGLAEAGGDGLAIAKEIYAGAHARYDELARPYAAVVSIDTAQLPAPGEVAGWSAEQFAGALRHDESCGLYNPNLRQFVHIAFKVAAEMGPRYINALRENEEGIARGVTHNLLERHIKPIFG